MAPNLDIAIKDYPSQVIKTFSIYIDGSRFKGYCYNSIHGQLDQKRSDKRNGLTRKEQPSGFTIYKQLLIIYRIN